MYNKAAILAILLAIVGIFAISVPQPASAETPQTVVYPDYSDTCMVCWFDTVDPEGPMLFRTTGILTLPWPGTIFTYEGEDFIVSSVTWDLVHWDVMCTRLA